MHDMHNKFHLTVEGRITKRYNKSKKKISKICKDLIKSIS